MLALGRHFQKVLYVHVVGLEDFVKVRPALLAVVFIWDDRLVVEAHAATMLPDMAVVALDEEIAHVFCERWQNSQ